MADLAAYLATLGRSALLAAELLLLTYAAKKVDDWRTTAFDDDALIVESGNLALALRRAGLYLGGMTAMAGVLSGPSGGLLQDLGAVLVFGIAAYAALFAARALCHRVVLRGIDDDGACKDGNVAVGVVEGGLFLASGVVLEGAVAGSSSSFWRGLVAFAVFFALGQVVLLAAAHAQSRLGGGAREEIARDNRAAGVEVAGFLVAVALVLRATLAGPSQGMSADAAAFLASALAGIALLLAFQYVVRSAFLRRASVRRALAGGNVAVAITLQSLTIAFAAVVARLVG